MVTTYTTTKFRSKIVYPVDQRVKFIKSGKYEQDFKSGDFGVVHEVISPFPSATDTIYSIVHEDSGELMWATGDDIMAFHQTTLDEEAEWQKAWKDKVNETPSADRVHVLCDCFYDEAELIPCIRNYDHVGWHSADGGLTWARASKRYHPLTHQEL